MSRPSHPRLFDYFLYHLVNNTDYGAPPASCHFIPPTSKYFPQYSVLSLCPSDMGGGGHNLGNAHASLFPNSYIEYSKIIFPANSMLHKPKLKLGSS